MKKYIFDTLCVVDGVILDESIHLNKLIKNGLFTGYITDAKKTESVLKKVYEQSVRDIKVSDKRMKLNIFLYEDGSLTTKLFPYNENENDILFFDGLIRRRSKKRYFKDTEYKDLYEKNNYMFNRFLDVILVNEKDQICECLTSNIFFFKDDLVLTPDEDCGLYKGCTRERFINNLNAENISIKKSNINIEEIDGFDRCIITSSLKGIREVKEILLKTPDLKMNKHIKFNK